MTQQCVGATGKHGGEAVALEGEARMTDGVNPTIEAMKAARGDLSADTALRVARRSEQLADRYHSVLPRRHRGQQTMAVLRP